MTRARAISAWTVFAAAVLGPLTLAATSPLLAWRDPIYIAAGVAGVLAMGLLMAQPLLAGRLLPGLSASLSRRMHAWIGGGLIALVLAHVGGLWLTSPPDVVDALLFRSPTPFSAWGVVGMWALFAAGLIAVLRRRVRIRPALRRLLHVTLALLVVVTSVVHAMLIDGTMEIFSKAALCGLVLAAALKVAIDLRVWSAVTRRRT